MIVIHLMILVMVLLGVAIIVFTKNVVHAAYALGLALIGIAGVYVLLQAELLAVVQILLYAGGVLILLVFGVMMTNRLRGEKVMSGSKNQILSGIISLNLFAFLAYLISSIDFSGSIATQPANQVESIGIAFLTEHIVAFELIAFILLVALVGAAYLAKMSSHE